MFLFILLCFVFLLIVFDVVLVFVFGVSSVFFAGEGVFLFVVVCFALFVLECFCYFWFFSCCLLLACFCFVPCVSWSGLGVVLGLLFWCVLLVFVFVSLCLFLSVSYENHCFPCNSSIFWFIKNELLFLISVSGSCFLFLFCLLFVSRCSFVFVFCFVSACSLVLVSSHAIIFVALHLVFLLLFFVFVALVFCYFLNCDDLSKTSLKNLEIPKTPKMRNAEKKKQTFGQEQLAQVFSHIVFFVFFCASLNFACFAENIAKLWFHP